MRMSRDEYASLVYGAFNDEEENVVDVSVFVKTANSFH